MLALPANFLPPRLAFDRPLAGDLVRIQSDQGMEQGRAVNEEEQLLDEIVEFLARLGQ